MSVQLCSKLEPGTLMSLDRRGSITVGKRFSAASNADSGRPGKDSELIVELLNRLMHGCKQKRGHSSLKYHFRELGAPRACLAFPK